MFIDEVAHSFKASQLETVGIAKGESTNSTCPVITCFRIFNLVVEKYDLRASTTEDLVNSPDLAEYAVGIFHLGSVLADVVVERMCCTGVPGHFIYASTLRRCWQVTEFAAKHSDSHFELLTP